MKEQISIKDNGFQVVKEPALELLSFVYGQENVSWDVRTPTLYLLD